MVPSPLAWLLRLAAFYHLCTPLAGQHLGVTKCNITCHKMTSPIPMALLIHYRPNQESCGKRAIILETRQHRHFCADPKEEWVQDAIKHLDRQATTQPLNSAKFEKLIIVTPGITLAARGPSPSALAEPEVTVEGLTLELTTTAQEAQRPMGTSQELPAAVTGSSPSNSKARDAGLSARPQTTGIFEESALSTTIWQSSAVYQSESSLRAEEKATEPPSTTAPSTQAPTISHSTPEENVGSESQPPWVQGQSPSTEKPLGPEETNQAHTDDFQERGPGNIVHSSVAPISSEGTPSRELVTSGSWPPKAEEPIHATADPQKLSVLITPVPDTQEATRRQAVGLLAFLGLLFCLGVAMFAYQSLQGCPRKMAGEMVEGLRYVPVAAAVTHMSWCRCTPTPRTKMTATGPPCLKDKPQKRMTSPWESEDPGQGQNSHNILQESCENFWKGLCPGHKVTAKASSMSSMEQLGNTYAPIAGAGPADLAPARVLGGSSPNPTPNSPNPPPSELPVGRFHPEVTHSLVGRNSGQLALFQSEETSPSMTLPPGKFVGGSGLALWAGGTAA